MNEYKTIMTRLFCRRGYAYMFFGRVIIHPESPGYLVPHEIVHVDQAERIGMLRWYWRYFTDSTFRLAAEVEAHKAAIRAGQPNWQAAQQLWTNYGLSLSYNEVLRMLDS